MRRKGRLRLKYGVTEWRGSIYKIKSTGMWNLNTKAFTTGILVIGCLVRFYSEARSVESGFQINAFITGNTARLGDCDHP